MKTKLQSISIIAFVFMLMTNTSYGQDNIKVLYNGSQLAFDVNPYIKDSRTLVPFRKILETLGATVSWDESSKKVIAQKGSTQIQLKIGSREAMVNGKGVSLDVSPEISGGRTFVPLRFVSENLGASVSWDGNSKSISIAYPLAQTVVSKVTSGGYEQVSVKNGIPVKLILRVGKSSDINGCNGTVIIPKYGISKKLAVGDNIIEFTPMQTGSIPFSCWMGMVQSKINVN